jgi:hypothetical protein
MEDQEELEFFSNPREIDVYDEDRRRSDSFKGGCGGTVSVSSNPHYSLDEYEETKE